MADVTDLVRVRVRTCEMTTYEGVLTMSRAKFELLRREVAAGDEDAMQEVHECLLLDATPILDATEPETARVLSFELDDDEDEDEDEDDDTAPAAREA